jgi:LPXTG-site transpeptidase (sortase) family protein
VDAPVVLSPIQNQTWQVDHLGQVVGHLEGTAPPGSDSNIVLAGHVTLSAGVYGPFAGLGQLAAGDAVTVYYGDQQFNYLVDEYQTVDRTAIEVTYPSETGQITLITCNNWSDEESRYIQRLIVRGHLVKE